MLPESFGGRLHRSECPNERRYRYILAGECDRAWCRSCTVQGRWYRDSLGRQDATWSVWWAGVWRAPCPAGGCPQWCRRWGESQHPLLPWLLLLPQVEGHKWLKHLAGLPLWPLRQSWKQVHQDGSCLLCLVRHRQPYWCHNQWPVCCGTFPACLWNPDRWLWSLLSVSGCYELPSNTTWHRPTAVAQRLLRNNKREEKMRLTGKLLVLFGYDLLPVFNRHLSNKIFILNLNWTRT